MCVAADFEHLRAARAILLRLRAKAGPSVEGAYLDSAAQALTTAAGICLEAAGFDRFTAPIKPPDR